MATSNNFDFSVTRDDIIKSALRVLGLVKQGTNPPTTWVAGAAEALNMLIKELQSENIGLWLNKQLTVFLQADTQSYSIGPSAGYATESYVQTALSADAAEDDLTIVVDSVTGIATTYYIAVELDDGTLQWTTVNGAPSVLTVTLTAALTGNASADNAVFCFQTKTQQPIQILEARLRSSDGTDNPVEIISRAEYMSISDKDSEGVVSKIYYDRQLTNGTLYVWPSPDDVSSVLMMTIKKPIQDFDAATNDADFPIQWAAALKFNLALAIAPEYMDDIAEDRMKYIIDMARESKRNAKGFDAEIGTSVYMVPDVERT